MHRDLKLDNLLLDNNANIKITDFGHAGIFQKGWDLFCTPTVGGLCHVAPEQLLGQPYSGEKNDIWGLGVILYILLVGSLPFKGQAYLDNIRNGRYTIPEHLSPEVRDLISNMLVTDPNGRIGCRKIMKHPWLTMGKKDSPNLDRFQLPIQPEKAVWNLPGGKICALCNVLRDLEIVTLHLNDKPQAEKDSKSLLLTCFIDWYLCLCVRNPMSLSRERAQVLFQAQTRPSDQWTSTYYYWDALIRCANVCV